MKRRKCCCWYNVLAIIAISATAFSPPQLPPTPIQQDMPTTQRDPSNMIQKQVVIVGGGIGGLAIASRIKASLAGAVQVTILERNERIGGRCGSFHVTLSKSVLTVNQTRDDSDDIGNDERLTFRHEHGPSLLLLPQIYEELFTDCNTTAQACGLHWKQCVPAYQCVFDDGSRIQVGYLEAADDRFATEIQQSRDRMDTFETNGSKHWDAYMKACEAFLDCGLPNFIENRLDLGSFPAFLRESLRDFGKAWPLKPHSDVLDSFFQSDKMKAVASFQDLYVGLEPFRNDKQAFGGVFGSSAPAVFGLLSAIELHPTNSKCGVYAPIGGFQAVTNALEMLARKLGVLIECNQTVTKVSSDGVCLCGTTDSSAESRFMPADLIVINADLPYAAKCLVTDDEKTTHHKPRFDWVEKEGGRDLMFSSGVVAFHWSLDTELHELSTHNVFLAAGSSDESRESWSALRDKYANFTGDAPFNFYVHRATCTDATAAPKGCDSLMILVPTKTLKRLPESRNLSRGETIESYKRQMDPGVIQTIRSAVLQRLAATVSLPDLETHILDEVVDTPATYADLYNLAAGTPFGLSHGFGQLSLRRPGPNFLRTPNVIAVGASSRPGNGVPLVMVGAKTASRLAIEKLKQMLSLNINSA
ncbi:hypothetical protein MPSEU_000149000 [Mayamaea pseudoterrestris]|nr:hypothetical protein MPSEU_000149000 [Mayamaea pseudoterrestris]